MSRPSPASSPQAERQPSALFIRPALVEDGRAVWQLVKDSGVLDVNSVYSYLLLFESFQDTCLVAERNSQVVGFVTAFKPPSEPETIFVWQIGVDASARGHGLGSLLLDRLLMQPACADVQWLKTTVTPSNKPSQGLFRRLAERHRTECEVSTLFHHSLFGAGHESEDLYRIGPFPDTPITETPTSP